MHREEAPTLPSLMVADVITPEGEWDLNLLSNLFPAETVDVIRAIPLTRNAQLQDNMFWTGSMDGSLMVKSAYQLIQAQWNLANPLIDSWRWIWKLQCAERIRIFIWLVIHGRLLTNSIRVARHMSSSFTCPRCNLSDETPIHLLRDCYYAQIIWGMLGFATADFFTMELLSWLKKFSTPSRMSIHAGIPRALLFLSALWLLWKDRNALIFKNHKSRPQELCALIFQQAKYTMIALNPISRVTSRQQRWVSWIPPDAGWYKLNSDGSYSAARNSANAGGLIRDNSGNWVSGFTVNVGCTSILIAELWGLQDGLRLCQSLGLPRIIAEMDSLISVRLINENREPDNLTAAILLEIKNLM
ncbi:hypothetical protein SLA2020_041140 [Shorea laevis]